MGKSLKGKELGVGFSQRKDGLYQARFTNRFGQRVTLYDKNLNTLRIRMRQAQSDNDKAINPIKCNMTLDEWYEVWVDTYKKNCRNTTLIQYATIYKGVQQKLGWRKLQTLSPLILQRTLNDLSTNTHRKSVKVLLSDLLDKAQQNNLLTKNPARNLTTDINEEVKKEKKVLTIQETELFLKYAHKCRYYNLFVVALETGMRIGELKGLYWSDVDFQKRVLSVNRNMCRIIDEQGSYFEIHNPKTFTGKRAIPLTEKCIQALERQKELVKTTLKCKDNKFDDLVFPARHNKPFQESVILRAIYNTVAKMNEDGIYIEKFGPHTFRHTFATRAIENGMQPKTLQRILGHSTLELTMNLYCHVTEDTLFDEMKKMEN